jgi:hypothetical protein
MAAVVNGLGPATDLGFANSAKVVGQTLRWAELVDEDVVSSWVHWEYCPAILGCYGALIAMIQHQPTNEALFEGRGNFGTPQDPVQFPHFTSCRLTALGERLARELLGRHPEYVHTPRFKTNTLHDSVYSLYHGILPDPK